MSEIKVGDLVMVAKEAICECPFPSEVTGMIFTVKDIQKSLAHCETCGKSQGILTLADGDLGAIEISRLKKIDPLSEPTEIKQAVEA